MLELVLMDFIGRGNRLWPSVPPHYYNVLDHFHVTDIWPVKTTGQDNISLIHWMVRFEKVDLLSKPWWAPINITDGLQVRETCPLKICTECNHPSKAIYTAGWTCLNYDCSNLFKFEHAAVNGQSSLIYDMKFLHERTDFQSAEPLLSLVPALPTAVDDNDFGTGKVARHGIVCRDCGCCTRRLNWNRWDCEGENCKFHYTIPFSIMSPEDVAAEKQAFKHRPYVNPDVASQYHEVIGGYQTELYSLAGENEGELAGGIAIFRATEDICAKPMGPNELFNEVQQVDIGLRRNSALHPGLKSEQVTSHFQSNWVSRNIGVVNECN